jgi:hypothetical protein
MRAIWVVVLGGAVAAGCSSGDDAADVAAAGGAAGTGAASAGVGGASGAAAKGGAAGKAGNGAAGATGGKSGSGGVGNGGGNSGGGGSGTGGGNSVGGGSGTGGGKSGSGGSGGSGVGGKGTGGSGTAGSGTAGSGTAGSGTSGAGGGGMAKSCKRGIAYGHNSVGDLTALAAGISWWYNWSPGPDAAVAADYAKLGVEFVPMIWGPGDLAANRVALIPKDAKVLLGFNEPNFKSQSNLSPQEAATLWPQLEKIANDRGMSLVSPALNYCGPASNCWTTDPFDWFDQFFAACPGCKVDALAVHWYACTKGALTSYLDKMKSKYGKPIWLTEFSCLDDPALKTSPANQATYMGDALTMLEADPMIARYSWFTGRWMDEPAIDLLGSGSGQLTSLGSKYVQAGYSCSPLGMRGCCRWSSWAGARRGMPLRNPAQEARRGRRRQRAQAGSGRAARQGEGEKRAGAVGPAATGAVAAASGAVAAAASGAVAAAGMAAPGRAAVAAARPGRAAVAAARAATASAAPQRAGAAGAMGSALLTSTRESWTRRHTAGRSRSSRSARRGGTRAGAIRRRGCVMRCRRGRAA